MAAGQLTGFVPGCVVWAGWPGKGKVGAHFRQVAQDFLRLAAQRHAVFVAGHQHLARRQQAERFVVGPGSGWRDIAVDVMLGDAFPFRIGTFSTSRTDSGSPPAPERRSMPPPFAAAKRRMMPTDQHGVSGCLTANQSGRSWPIVRPVRAAPMPLALISAISALTCVGSWPWCLSAWSRSDITGGWEGTQISLHLTAGGNAPGLARNLFATPAHAQAA